MFQIEGKRNEVEKEGSRGDQDQGETMDQEIQIFTHRSNVHGTRREGGGWLRRRSRTLLEKMP